MWGVSGNHQSRMNSVSHVDGDSDFLKKDSIYLFSESGEGRKKGWETLMCERNISCLLHILNRGPGCNPGMCPDWKLNWWLFWFAGWLVLNPLSHPGQGETQIWCLPAPANWFGGGAQQRTWHLPALPFLEWAALTPAPAALTLKLVNSVLLFLAPVYPRHCSRCSRPSAGAQNKCVHKQVSLCPCPLRETPGTP